MKNYFTPEIFEKIESEDVITIFKQADKISEKHIRIVIDENDMKLNLCSEELKIEQAVLFAWTNDGIDCMNFIPQSPDRAFYAAISPTEYLAAAIVYPEYLMEGVCKYGTKDTIFGIFETKEEIIYILFDGRGTHIARSNPPQADGIPNVFDALHAIYDDRQQDEEYE